MDSAQDPITALKAALQVSPDNLPLRRHLADQLSRAERFGEAVDEYRELLAREPDDDELRLALATAYLGDGKTGHADILVELVTGRAAAAGEPFTAEAFVLLARIRLAERDFRGARVAFQSACEIDPALESSDVAAELGVGLSNPFELDEDLEDLDLGIHGPAQPAPARSPALPGSENPALGSAEPGSAESGISEPGISESGRPAPGFPASEQRPTLQDMGGFASLRNRLRLAIVEPLARPDLFSAYGLEPGAVLLAGPQGSGREHMVRCVAGQSGRLLVEHRVGGSVEAEALRGLGDVAVMVHGIDAALARDRAATVEEVEGLLQLIQGGRGTLVALTDAPWEIPAGLVGRGRFDRLFAVPQPTDVDRREILAALLRSKPTRSIDLKKVARKCAGLHVADLVEVVQLAIDSAWRRAVEGGEVVPIAEKALIGAARRTDATASSWYDDLAASAEDPDLLRRSGALARLLRRATREN